MAAKLKSNPNTLQLALFTPEAAWRAPDLNDLPSWVDAQRVAIDTETRDPDLRSRGPGVRRVGSYVVGYSFAIDGGPAHYVPLRHLGGDNIADPDQGWAYLREQAKVFTGELVGQNLSYDLDFLAQNGVVFRTARKFRDVMIADVLCNELHNSYSLNAIAERRGLPAKREQELIEAATTYGVDPKGELWKLPARFVGPYAEQDALLPLQVLRLQEADIAEQGLQGIWDLESDLLPVLVKMRRRGIRIDWDRLSQIEEYALEQEREALEFVHCETGHRINVGDVWQTKALAPAIESVGIRLGKTEKTAAPQIDKALLGSGDHPVLDAIGKARKFNKLRTTFAQSTYTYATSGRIHCTLNQMFGEDENGKARGARFGRMSSESPNLQQVPSRGEFKEFRRIYLPEEGMLWATADYSQVEPRMAAHFAGVLGLTGAKEMVRRYCEEPDTDNHKLMAEITGLPREYAKIVLLGLMYGQGGQKLCLSLGLPTTTRISHKGRWYDFESLEGQQALALGGKRVICAGREGQAVLDKFDANAPFVRKLSKVCEDIASKRGYIKTILGRRCRFPMDENGNYDWCYRGLNRLAQGSSADQIKQAIVNADRENVYLQLQVHDELDFSTSSREEANKVGIIMRDSVKASLPFKVDVEVGPNWCDIS